ncbi:MAG TPA: NADPH-dependent 7-cyano-7-deazaguanine reductase QueF [Thermodesulfobium narugense]|uniref:NADPH-dependent 7-cyano-7-deazaguanine reductase n=1 Tax=Thermodesulfobium acidiphilum TaxID=1794699 RepID=A0A2R4W2K4_THEAF|nr:preQ(1) synthase [Thermodesulfobium acidiphilum]AWB11051.1 7-cyano-7-deazaguanine reductase [Thermodesulfobium acidiphilum]PMP85045.1 MAG: NADPH-dependent 7-cyano-7-deazaguanine reductase QueF [Thermodesulfobium narugense]HEM55292.1 NADPH-dependent 7-cyano-7-deazaguanine reductase QueF [Thermodesulfobium narugense]
MPEASGKTFEFKDESHIKTDFLEGFSFSAEEYIKIETKEFSAVCPFSGLPDIGQLIIEYFPDGGICVELKSLKYYLTSFRNVGIYQEAATKRIYEDLKKLLKTDRLKVTLIYNTRGGINTLTSMGNL